MASYQKEVEAVLRAAEEQNWRIKPKKNGWMLMSPDGVTKVMIHQDRKRPPRARQRHRVDARGRLRMGGPLVLFRFRVTIDGYGRDEDAAEHFLEAFVAVHREVGPVVAQNTESNTLSVVYSLEAADLDEAVDAARPIFLEAAGASGLEPAPVIEWTAQLVRTPERDLQPA